MAALKPPWLGAMHLPDAEGGGSSGSAGLNPPYLGKPDSCQEDRNSLSPFQECSEMWKNGLCHLLIPEMYSGDANSRGSSSVELPTDVFLN